MPISQENSVIQPPLSLSTSQAEAIEVAYSVCREALFREIDKLCKLIRTSKSFCGDTGALALPPLDATLPQLCDYVGRVNALCAYFPAYQNYSNETEIVSTIRLAETAERMRKEQDEEIVNVAFGICWMFAHPHAIELDLTLRTRLGVERKAWTGKGAYNAEDTYDGDEHLD